MTFYVDTPAKSSIQGVWCYPPQLDDGPSYICDRAREGLTITDLGSLRRFFREKCKWPVASVRHISEVVFLDHQTWQDKPYAVWTRANQG